MSSTEMSTYIMSWEGEGRGVVSLKKVVICSSPHIPFFSVLMMNPANEKPNVKACALTRDIV